MAKTCCLKIVLKILTLLQLLNDAVLSHEDFFSSPEISTSMTSSLFPVPTPTPLPVNLAFMSYTDKYLVLLIEDIRIEYSNYVIRTGDLAMLQVNNSLQLEQDQLMFSSSYSQDGREQFRLSFLFTKDTKEMEWHVRMFQHENITRPELGIYQYEEIYSTIVAPIGVGFDCSDLKFFGTAVGFDRTYNSNVKFTGIFILPFIVNKNVSQDLVFCSKPSNGGKKNRQSLIVIIGPVLTFCVATSTIAIAFFLVRKYQKRWQYNILSN